ncbi:MAG: hypothetical protein KJ906_01270 [Nanoarchaeota archaeon]|nr:hypothetical protein [Nanoarchaeota archaeon]
MIGTVDFQRDVTVYLTPEEISKISSEVIEGVLIRISNKKQQGQVFVSVNDERKSENGYGVGIVDRLWEECPIAELFVGDYAYQRLKERGGYGTRYGQIGSKIDINDLSKIGRLEASGVKQLEWYVENKDKLSDKF